MADKFHSVGRAATKEMLASEAPLTFTSPWQASAIAAGLRAGLTDAEIEEMTGFVSSQAPDQEPDDEEGNPRYSFG